MNGSRDVPAEFIPDEPILLGEEFRCVRCDSPDRDYGSIAPLCVWCTGHMAEDYLLEGPADYRGRIICKRKSGEPIARVIARGEPKFTVELLGESNPRDRRGVVDRYRNRCSVCDPSPGRCPHLRAADVRQWLKGQENGDDRR